MLATTNYLTQNIASIPFLWILPLSLYLLTFTFCFDRSGWYKDRDLTAMPDIATFARELKSKPGISLWTDDYSNLVQIVKYKLP